MGIDSRKFEALVTTSTVEEHLQTLHKNFIDIKDNIIDRQARLQQRNITKVTGI